jgi:hypothetical protein
LFLSLVTLSSIEIEYYLLFYNLSHKNRVVAICYQLNTNK